LEKASRGSGGASLGHRLVDPPALFSARRPDIKGLHSDGRAAGPRAALESAPRALLAAAFERSEPIATIPAAVNGLAFRGAAAAAGDGPCDVLISSAQFGAPFGQPESSGDRPPAFSGRQTQRLPPLVVRGTRPLEDEPRRPDAESRRHERMLPVSARQNRSRRPSDHEPLLDHRQNLAGLGAPQARSARRRPCGRPLNQRKSRGKADHLDRGPTTPGEAALPPAAHPFSSEDAREGKRRPFPGKRHSPRLGAGR